MVAVFRSASGLIPALVSAGFCLDRGLGARRRGSPARSVTWYAAGPFVAYAAGVAPLAVAAAAVLVVAGQRLYAFAVAEDDDPAVPGAARGRPGEDTDPGSQGGTAQEDERPDG
jgi:hypothetical protein